MLFIESGFFLFFVVVFAGAWALRGNRGRKLWLLGASYAFYAAWDWRFLGLIALSTLIDFLAAPRIAAGRGRAAGRAWLLLSLVANLGILLTFKYLDFFATSAAALLSTLGLEASWTTLSLTLPVGISFFTFQSMSYSLDVHRGVLEPRRSWVDFALFVAFFPQLVAGPIVRARDFLPQLDEPRRLVLVPVRACLVLFWIGFFKKACVGDNLATWVDPVFADPSLYTALAQIGAAWLYAAQIYCDFSGYSDMAIATAGLLGYRLPRNFAAPYFATSVAEFWRRWHISLSTWLRDYLYISLGGNRKGSGRTRWNLMATMLLGGLWHGASWNFVIWGGLHGVALIAHRLWSAARSSSDRGQPGALGRGVAMLVTAWWVVLAWIFFRAATLDDAATMVAAFVLGRASGTAELPDQAWPVLAGAVLVHALAWRLRPEQRAPKVPIPIFVLAYALAWAFALLWVPLEARPFIYFQF